MRCVQCDANDQGLSDFRGDSFIPSRFFFLPNGDCLCNECYDWNAELESDYYSDDEEENDE